MRQTRYQEIIACYGTNPKRWPQSEREPALAFARAHPKIGQQAQKAADHLDLALDENTRPKTDNHLLMARILKQANATPQDAKPALPNPPFSLPLKSLAATLLITTGLGFTLGQTAQTSSDIAQAEALLASNVSVYEPYNWLGDENE